MKLEYKVNSNQYKTIKEVLNSHFHISKRLLAKLKQFNKITLNGFSSVVNSPISLNDIICVDLSFEEKSKNIVPIQMKLEIIFEDEAMIILNKSAGTPVHPSMAHFQNSLSNGVQYYFEENEIHTKIRPVNRLDKDTSRPCHIR